VVVVVGPPGVVMAVAVGPPGVVMAVTVGPPDVCAAVGVDVTTTGSVWKPRVVMRVEVRVGVAGDTRTGAVRLGVGRALCVVPADGGVDVARGVCVARPVGAQGVIAPVGAIGSPGAVVGCGAGGRHGASIAVAAGAACLCTVRIGVSRPFDDAGFARTTTL